MVGKRRVLILCTGNSCRSQIAEGLWRQLGGDGWDVQSAGAEPTGYVHPKAIEAMEVRGIDLASARSKSVDEYAGQTFDLVITVCDAARTACRSLPEASERKHWPFDDPADSDCDDDSQQTAVFGRVRDEIETQILNYLARELP